MKIHGNSIELPPEEVVVIPRASGDIIFRMKPVTNIGEIDEKFPRPEPTTKRFPGGQVIVETDTPEYTKKIADWAEQKTHYIIIQSLSATEGLEWETVDLSDPTTFGNYSKELEDSGLMQGEVAVIQMAVLKACGLDQSKIEEATERFLAGQGQTPSSESSPDIELVPTPSTEPVSDSD